MRIGDARDHKALWSVLLRWHDRGRYSGPTEAVGKDPQKLGFYSVVPPVAYLSYHHSVLQGIVSGIGG